MPSSINGIGTMWYGHALEQSDGSYVVTEWVTVLGIPLVPLGSKRVVWDEKRDAENRAKSIWRRQRGVGYYRAAQVPLYMPHIVKGYAVTVGIALLLLLV